MGGQSGGLLQFDAPTEPAGRDSGTRDEPECRPNLTERDRSDREANDENDDLRGDEPACQDRVSASSLRAPFVVSMTSEKERHQRQ
jgi:hypothetical protein